MKPTVYLSCVFRCIRLFKFQSPVLVNYQQLQELQTWVEVEESEYMGGNGNILKKLKIKQGLKQFQFVQFSC